VSAGSLIGPLSISGSNTNTGTPNAGGSFFAYIVGTTTQIPIYSDAAATIAVTQPVVLDNAGRIPYSTYPNGLYCIGAVRLYVLAADGSTVISDTVYQTVANSVAFSNADFPNEHTVDDAFLALGTSFGGIDGQYQAPSGTTPRMFKSVLSSLQLTPQDFGALGDGLHDDTSAIQAALNALKAAGGGTLYFSPGTYKTSAAISLSSATGISIKGTGGGSTIIKLTAATGDLFSFTSCGSLHLSGFLMSNSSSTTGNSITLTNCVNTFVERVSNNVNQFAIGLYSSGASSNVIQLLNCNLFGNGGSGRGLKTETPFTSILWGSYGSSVGSPVAIELTLAAGDFIANGVGFLTATANTAFLFNAALTGSRFAITNCTTLALIALPFDLSGLSTNPKLYQAGNGVDGVTYSAAIGNTLSPLLQYGNDSILVAASGGAGIMTVAAPVPTPSAAHGQYFTWHFKNAAGGAVTWSTNAVFVFNTTIPTTDGHTISVLTYWDTTTSKFREIGRSDTVT
jgi:hypothetical protein